MASRFLIFSVSITAVLAVMAASAQQTVIPVADTAANPQAGQTARGVVLKIDSDPPEAAVKIDGRDYGPTPVEAADLDTGAHVVELSKGGYFRRKATVVLDSSGAELRFELSRPASLLVTSEPAGARVTIDGQDAGASPAQNDKMRPGEHRVSAALEGYEGFDAAVRLESGGVDTLHITLEPVIAAPPQEQPTEQAKTADKSNPRWQSGTILIAFFVFIAVLIGVEKSSY